MDGKPWVLAGIGAVIVGIWLLAVSPEPDANYQRWRPAEPFDITSSTGNQTWTWGFDVPNPSDRPMRVEAAFWHNLTTANTDHDTYWNIITEVYVEGVHVTGLDRGGGECDGCYWRNRLPYEWTIPPGGTSRFEVRAQNQPQASSEGWVVNYNPEAFEVTTTTQSLDWALAGPGAGLLLAGFGVVAVVAVPWRLRG